MAITDFDKIIDIIEEDLDLGWPRIRTIINNKIYNSKKDIDAFFKVIEPEGMNVWQYYKFRRVCKAMNDYIEGDTLENIAEKYDYTDAAHLSSEIKKKLGKSPKILLAENFICPKSQHIVDIIKDNGMLPISKDNDMAEMKEQVINHMKLNEDKYKCELISAIDNIIALQNENEQLKSIIRREQIAKQTSGAQIDMLMLSTEIYEEFMEIERCRTVYDLKPEEVIKIYHESVRTGKNLEELCIEADNNYTFEDYQQYDNEIEKLKYMIEYEGDLDDVRREYFDDDDPADCEADPYARKEWDLDNYKQNDDRCPEDYYEDDCIDKSCEDDFEHIEKVLEEVQNQHKRGMRNKEEIEINIEIDDEDVWF